MQDTFLKDIEDDLGEMKSNVYKHLPSLFALARDRSEAGRSALADKLTQVFLAETAALSAHEERLVNELIEDLLKSQTPQARQALITRFAEAIEAPREIALRIAKGPSDIAIPVLSANENLFDEDLISIVKTKTSDHAAAIATRKKVSEAVADALVATGDLQIMYIVAENMGATLSPKSLNVMIESARLSSLLQKPLLNRPELTPENAAHLYWWTSQDLRRATLERFGFGPGKLDENLKQAIHQCLEDGLLHKDDLLEMKSIADWLEERNALDIKLLPQLLRSGHYRLFNVILSRLAQLEMNLIDVILGTAGGRYMVVVCRALGIEKGNFVSLFLMSRGGRPGEQIVHPRELTEALIAFDRLDAKTAKKMLEKWRQDPHELMEHVQKMGAEEQPL